MPPQFDVSKHFHTFFSPCLKRIENKLKAIIDCNLQRMRNFNGHANPMFQIKLSGQLKNKGTAMSVCAVEQKLFHTTIRFTKMI